MQDARTEIKRLPVWQPLAGRQLPAQNWGKPQSRTSGTPAWGGSSWSPQSPHPGFLHRVAPKAVKITTYSAKLKQISGHNLTLPQFAPPPHAPTPTPTPPPGGPQGDLCLTFHLQYLVFYDTQGEGCGGGNQDLSAEIKRSHIKELAASSKHKGRYTETSGSPRDPAPLAAEGVKLHHEKARPFEQPQQLAR